VSGPLYYVFCDGSFNAHKNRGVGAILILSSLEFEELREGTEFPILTKVIDSNSISRVEITTALWALADSRLESKEITLFTDCKTLEGLPSRRKRLEAKSFKSGRTGKLLSHADLYQEFYEVYDNLHPEIVWIKGHSKAQDQTEFQRVFSFVDKKAREVLRQQD
jgi:ribonuclease HI